MADFNKEEAQQVQSEILNRVRAIRDDLNRDVIDYYVNDRVDNEEDAKENLRGMHRFLKAAYQGIDRLLTELERRGV